MLKKRILAIILVVVLAFGSTTMSFATVSADNSADSSAEYVECLVQKIYFVDYVGGTIPTNLSATFLHNKHWYEVCFYFNGCNFFALSGNGTYRLTVLTNNINVRARTTDGSFAVANSSTPFEFTYNGSISASNYVLYLEPCANEPNYPYGQPISMTITKVN